MRSTIYRVAHAILVSTVLAVIFTGITLLIFG